MYIEQKVENGNVFHSGLLKNHCAFLSMWAKALAVTLSMRIKLINAYVHVNGVQQEYCVHPLLLNVRENHGDACEPICLADMYVSR